METLDFLYATNTASLFAGEQTILRSGRTISKVTPGLSVTKCKESLAFLGKIEKRHGRSLTNKLVSNLDEVKSAGRFSDDVGDGFFVGLKNEGVNAKIYLVEESEDFILKMNKYPDEYTLTLDPTTINKGAIGEATADWLAEKNNWGSPAKGFHKTNINQHGIDRIYYDPKTDMYTLVESKFTSSTGNVGKSSLSKTRVGRQFSDEWCNDALTQMVREGLISPELADKVRLAKLNGKLRKKLVVVQNSPMDGTTVLGSLTEEGLNINEVNLIKIGETI